MATHDTVSGICSADLKRPAHTNIFLSKLEGVQPGGLNEGRGSVQRKEGQKEVAISIHLLDSNQGFAPSPRDCGPISCAPLGLLGRQTNKPNEHDAQDLRGKTPGCFKAFKMTTCRQHFS